MGPCLMPFSSATQWIEIVLTGPKFGTHVTFARHRKLIFKKLGINNILSSLFGCTDLYL
jgi:hypothetical protein